MVFNVFVFFVMVFDICSIFSFPTAGASLQLVPNSKFRIQNSKFFSAKDKPSKNAAKVLIIFINTK